MKGNAIIDLVRTTLKEWSEDKAARLGAALAYYTIFSIGPLVLVMVAIAGAVFGQEAAQGQVVSSIRGVVGAAGAEIIQETLKHAAQPDAGVVSSLIGMGTLLLAATGIFGQLQDALNTIWGVRPQGGGIVGMLKERLLTFFLVLGTGVLLLAALLVNALLALLHEALVNALPGGAFVLQILNYLVTFGLMTVVFAVIYKVLPDVYIRWRDVWIGAAVTAALFMLGQFVLALYLSLSNPGTAYGAAGSLVIVLVWIYYTAQIVFLGAEFTQVYAHQFGADLRPKPKAEWISEEERAKQGMEAEQAGPPQATEPARRRTPRFFRPSRPEPEPAPRRAAPVTAGGESALSARQGAQVLLAALGPVLGLWVLGRLASVASKRRQRK
jgi:membrane protein